MLDRPTDDLAVEQVQHDGQVQPAFTGLDVREVTSPHAVGASGVKSRASRFGATGSEWLTSSFTVSKA